MVIRVSDKKQNYNNVTKLLVKPKLKKQILEYFTLLMSDNVKARELCSDGHYKQIISQKAPLNSHEECMNLAIQMAKQTQKPEKGFFQHIIKSLRKGA